MNSIPWQCSSALICNANQLRLHHTKSILPCVAARRESRPCRLQQEMRSRPPASVARRSRLQILTEPNWTVIGQEIFSSCADPVQITWLGKVCGVVAKSNNGRWSGAFRPRSGFTQRSIAVSDPSTAERQNLGLHFCRCICNQTIEAKRPRLGWTKLSPKKRTICEALPPQCSAGRVYLADYLGR